MIQRDQPGELEKQILEQIAVLENERLLKIREKFDSLAQALENTALLMVLPEEREAGRRTLKRTTEQIKRAIDQEYGRRLLRSYENQFQRLLIKLKIQQPVVREALIIPFPQDKGEEPIARMWMVCINGQEQATAFLDGIPIIVEKEAKESLEGIRRYVCECMREQDRYTEIFVTQDLDQERLCLLVDREKAESHPKNTLTQEGSSQS